MDVLCCHGGIYDCFPTFIEVILSLTHTNEEGDNGTRDEGRGVGVVWLFVRMSSLLLGHHWMGLRDGGPGNWGAKQNLTRDVSPNLDAIVPTSAADLLQESENWGEKERLVGLMM